MALTKVIGAGLGTVTEDQVFGGATPTVTIGDAGAEDTKIVFDGNAQDFHIGLDDSADTLNIGLGSTLGTTSHMIFDANGIIIKPLQPAFMAQPSSKQLNVATNATTTVIFGTERFDQNADFASNTFTAPVTGKYFLAFSAYLENLDTAAQYYQLDISTSNRNYYELIDPNFSADLTYFPVNIAAVADMDASDTAIVRFSQQAGTAQTDIPTDAIFMGYLLG
jgi:hypothetical protein